VAQAFDEGELLERVDHDLGFLAETVEMLTSDGPALLGEVRASLAAGDAAGVGRHAHALKGMISNFCAADAQAAALEVERMGKSGDLSAAAVAVERLSGLLTALTESLRRFVKARA
jgi:HPt (histidine-containing phosphotransfer) domain-containing protein